MVAISRKMCYNGLGFLYEKKFISAALGSTGSMKKYLLFLILLTVVSLLAVSCGEAVGTASGDDSTTSTAPDGSVTAGNPTTTPAVTLPPETTEADTTYEDVYYDLSPIEGEMGEPLRVNWNPYLFSPVITSDGAVKEGAEALVKAILNRRLSVTFSSREVMLAVADNIFFEFPPSALCSFTPDKEGATLRISYSLKREEHLAAMTAFGDRVEDLIAETLVFGDNEAEKALLLYHKVGEVVDYFKVGYKEWQTGGYYALMGGNAICYGFADAYNHLLRQVGMEAYLVKSYRPTDLAPHGWSLVRIDGIYYHCDPTWEDSMFEGAGFWYFGNTDDRRDGAISLSMATVGEGSLKSPIPYRVTDTRFYAIYKKSITRPEWVLDKEKQVLVYERKEYSYAKS